MLGERRPAEAAKAAAEHALVAGRARTPARPATRPTGPQALLALQRKAGNAAVNALLTAKGRAPEGGGADLDAALTEIKRDEPDIDTVEKGLRAAQSAGVPVDLEGPKPPPGALAVTKTGFGPDAVAPKKPVPPPKPVPPVSPAGMLAAGAGRGRSKGGAPAAGGRPKGGKGNPRGTAPSGGAGVASDGLASRGGGGEGMALAPEALRQPPVPPSPTRPEDDPGFNRVVGGVTRVAKQKKAHAPAAAKAEEAQGAALAPGDDVEGQAKAAKLDSMDAQPAGTFDKKAFIAAVKAAIEAKSPKTLEEADEYAESGKATEVKGDVKGLVTQGTEAQGKDIEGATEAPPDPSKAVPKPVTPMVAESPGPAPAVAAAGAVPKPAPPEQLNLAAGTHEANDTLAEGGVTEQQLAQSNEPEFQQALADKQAAATHATTAPGEFRQQEQQVLQQTKGEAAAETAAGLTGMQGAKVAAVAKLAADKGQAKSRDEAKRAEVTTKIQAIFTATEAEVRAILDGIDPKVDAEFEQGEAQARARFEAYVDAKMRAYKKDRYGGWLGGLRWAKDKLVGMPDKVNEFYEAGRELYLKEMDGVISRVADIVGGDLGAAKKRIAAGKAEVAAYVKSLPAELRKVGDEAATEIGDGFQQLEADVEAKQEAVVDSLATKYVEARKGLDERIEALQAENKGLVDKAIGAIKAVINTIRQLAAMLTDVLARAAGVVGHIIKDPVGFLGNLIEGIKGGITKFKDGFVEHLRKGLLSWLFGTLADAGVELPDTFDLKGVIKLLASIFGLTWRAIRNRIVKQIGEKAMGAVEKGVEVFQLLANEGVAGLWQMLLDKVGDIKEMILEQVKDFVVTRIVVAGITWLISLLNPAAAFIKACKLIYDVVMFFVSNASRIAQFVNTVLDSVADVVRGNVGSVVNKINDVLGQMVPIIIGFLASLVGLGGIGQKIRQIVETLQKPVKKALDAVIKTGLKLAAPVIRGLKGISTKVKAKVAAGKAWVKGKAEQAKAALFKVSERLPGHKVYNRNPGSTELLIASTPSPFEVALTRAVANKPQTLKDLAAGIISAYRTAKQTADALPADQQKKKYAIMKAMITESRPDVRKLLAKTGVGSAPGIGSVSPWGSGSPSSMRNQPIKEWFMEKEHIIPRTLASNLFKAVAPQVTHRAQIISGGREYRSQYTIMIYKGAANRKTREDVSESRSFRAWASKLAGRIDFSESTTGDPYLEQVLGRFHALASRALERTKREVKAENARNRGKRADPDTGTQEEQKPSDDDIDKAYGLQMKELNEQFATRAEIRLD